MAAGRAERRLGAWRAKMNLNSGVGRRREIVAAGFIYLFSEDLFSEEGDRAIRKYRRRRRLGCREKTENRSESPKVISFLHTN